VPKHGDESESYPQGHVSLAEEFRARCNLSKSSNLSGIDIETGQTVVLFNPRTQIWSEHFAYSDAEIIGLTPTGRATVAVLNMNEPRRLQLRQELLELGELD